MDGSNFLDDGRPELKFWLGAEPKPRHGKVHTLKSFFLPQLRNKAVSAHEKEKN